MRHLSFALSALLNFSLLLPILSIKSKTKLTKSHQVTLGDDSPPEQIYRVVNSYNRTEYRYFVEGFAFLNDQELVESAGMYGESNIHVFRFGSVNNIFEAAKQKLNAKYFGEGCASLLVANQQKTYQLTWKERKVFVYNGGDLTPDAAIYDIPEPIKEGWGLAADAKKNQFFLSDGTEYIYVIDPEGFKIKDKFQVHHSNGSIVNFINELEVVEDKLWANVYGRPYILVLDPQNGEILSKLDFSGLYNQTKQYCDENGLLFEYNYVFNGIAYNPSNQQLLLTGKNWPFIYDVKVNGLNA